MRGYVVSIPVSSQLGARPLDSNNSKWSAGYVFSETTTKIKELVTSIPGQIVIGLGLGALMHKVYAPITNVLLKLTPFTFVTGPGPFSSISLPAKILLTPLICIIGPIMEEKVFRGDMQDEITKAIESFYAKAAPTPQSANIAARVTSVFFTSIVFGLIHFSNALVFMCNPVVFLPQVIAATIMGLIFGIAKEFSGELHLPAAMHIGNNTLAWTQALIV